MSKFNTILKKLFVKTNKLVIKNSDGTIKVFNISLNFFYIAVGLAVCLSIIAYKVRTEVVEDKKALIEHTANNLYTHVQDFDKFNTILITDTDYHTYALTAFKSNQYVSYLGDKANTDEVLTFFSNAVNNKNITENCYKKVSGLIAIKNIQINSLDQKGLVELEEANLLGSYLRLEFFKSKVIAIEANFIKDILTLVSDTGEPILIPYENQEEYDKAASYWLKKANKCVAEYLEKKESVMNTIVAFSQLNITPQFTKSNPMLRYRDMMQKNIITVCQYNTQVLAAKK